MMIMAVPRNSNGWVLVVFRRTKMCLGKAQAVLGESGGMFPREKFWKTEPNPANFVHSGSKNRVIAAWSAHKKYTENQKKKIPFG